MHATDLLTVFETILPNKVLMDIVEKAGFQERTRKLDALRFLRAMIIAAATGFGGRQADVMRLYFECKRSDPPLQNRQRLAVTH